MFAELRLRTGADLSGITILRNVSGLAFDSKFGDVGSINFSVPLADAVAAGLDENSVVEVCPNGLVVPNMWYGLSSLQEAQTTDGGVLVAYAGSSLISWLADGIVYPSTWHYATTPSDYSVTVTGSRTQIVPRYYSVVAASVTFQTTANTVTTTAPHNLSVNDSVQFATTTSTNVVANQVYYVQAVPSSTTFKLSTTKGGSVFTITSNGTGTGLTENLTSGSTSQTTIGGHSFENATPGFILRTLIDRAKERGCFSWLSATSFTGATATSGVPWNTTLTTTYSNGTTVLQVIQDLAARNLIEYRMDQNILRVYNVGESTTHWTADQITFRRGKNITEQTRTMDAASAADTVLIAGDRLAIGEIRDSSSTTALGRRREKFVTQGGIYDIPTLVTLMGGAELSISGHILTEDTLGISDNDILPWSAFNIGDWVWADFDGTLNNIQVQQISATQQDANNLQIGLTLGDVLQSEDARFQRLLDNITGQNAGSYGGLPNKDTGRPPSDPSGVVASATAYRDSNGRDVDQVTVTWTQPTTNVDGTTLTDLDRYEMQFQTTSNTYWTDAANIPADNAVIAGFVSNIPAGTSFVARVRAVNKDDHASNWVTSNTIATLPKVVTTPATPSTPTIGSIIRGISVNWNGLTSTSGTYDSSWARTDVFVSLSSTFTPSSTTLSGSFSTLGGTVNVTGLTYGNTYYVKLVTYDKSGNASAASAVSVGQTPAQVTATDLATNSVTAAAIQDGAVAAAKVANGSIDVNKLTVAAFGDSVVPNGSFEELTADPTNDTTGAAGWKFLSWPGSASPTTFTLDTTGTNAVQGNNVAKIHYPTGLNGGVIMTTKPVPTGRGDIWYVTLKVRGSLAITFPLQIAASLGDTIAEASIVSHTAGHGINLVAAAESVDGVTPGATSFGLTAGTFTTYEVAFTVPDNGANQFKYVSLMIGTPNIATNWLGSFDMYIDSVSMRPVGGSASITNLTVSKLTAGVLQSDVVVGSRIKTSDTGARVELNSAGLISYDATETETVRIDSATGSATFAGAVTGGSISAASAAGLTLTASEIDTTDYIIDTSGGSILIYELTGQTVSTFSTAGTTSWIVPGGVTGVTVECWGAGAGGSHAAGDSAFGQGGGGGGGGGYTRCTYLGVTPSDVYSITVGAGGAGGTTPAAVGTAGGDSSFGTAGGATPFILAAGGRPGATSIVGGIGQNGSWANTGSANVITFAGGGGGAPKTAASNAGGGGGGESAYAGGSGNAGGKGTTSAGGAGGSGSAGGNGGAGGGPGSVGSAAPTFGGGGGGGGYAAPTFAGANGGAGAPGKIVLTYGGTYTLVASISATGGTETKYGTGTVYPAGIRTYRNDLIGVIGGYYDEFTLSNQTFATATDTNVTNLTRATNYSDFSAPMNLTTGTWTCPSSGVYTFTFKVTFNSWVTNSNVRLQIANNTTSQNIGYLNTSPSGSSSVQESVSCTKFVALGDTINFQIRQVTGGNQTLVGSGSYISILRQS